MEGAYQKLLRCTQAVKQHIGTFVPRIGLILGTGLNDFVEHKVRIQETIEYGSIEGFPVSTVEGHKGRFVFGYIEDVPVVIMQGRVHYYEGYSMEDVLLPVRLMGMLNIEVLFVTNGSGAVNRSFATDDLMLITDHVSLFIPSPLLGKNIDELGKRFPDMSEAYCKDLCELIRCTANEIGIKLHEGIYAQLTGPQYETPAEICILDKLGIDAVGMSTVCEVIAANHMGLRVCGISSIGNMAAGIESGPLSHDMGRVRNNNPFESLVVRSIVRMAAMHSTYTE